MAQPHLVSSPVRAEANRLRLLLLEATEDDVFSIKEELTRNLTSPFTLRWADSLEAFFAAFAEFAPHVVLSAYSLPDLDCRSALRAIREWDRNLPVILVTGCLQEEHAIEAMQRGATDYVLKERLSRLAPVVERAVKEAREIASRQEAEEGRRGAESELRTMLGNLPALAFKGWMDGSASFYDDRVEALTGYPKEVFDRRALTWLDLIHPEDQPKAHKVFRQALEGDESYVREYRIIVKSGEVMWIQERSHITCTPAGQVDHVSGIILDITEHRKTHEALSRSLAESERSRREISSLLKGARAVLEQEDFALAARKIFDSCRQITGAVSGYVALLSATGEEDEVLFLEE
jgi:phosphoserine phosphatase RsbU/P